MTDLVIASDLARNIVDPLLAAAAALLLGFLTKLVWRGLDWLGLDADHKVRTYLLDGVEAGIQLGIVEARRRLQAGLVRGGDSLRQIVLDTATAYTAERFPDALKRFGLAPPAVTQIVDARAPDISALVEIIAPARAAPAAPAAVEPGDGRV